MAFSSPRRLSVRVLTLRHRLRPPADVRILYYPQRSTCRYWRSWRGFRSRQAWMLPRRQKGHARVLGPTVATGGKLSGSMQLPVLPSHSRRLRCDAKAGRSSPAKRLTDLCLPLSFPPLTFVSTTYSFRLRFAYTCPTPPTGLQLAGRCSRPSSSPPASRGSPRLLCAFAPGQARSTSYTRRTALPCSRTSNLGCTTDSPPPPAKRNPPPKCPEKSFEDESLQSQLLHHQHLLPPYNQLPTTLLD